MTNVLVATKFRVFAEGLENSLKKEKCFSVFTTENYHNILTISKNKKIDIIIIEPNPSFDDITSIISSVNDTLKNVKVILISDNEAEISKCIKLGIKGIIEKEHDISQVIKMIKLVAEGNICISRKAISSLYQAIDIPHLSKREIEILKLIKDGFSNKEIAKKLNITEKTVKNQCSLIFQKLEVKNRTSAVIKAIHLQII